MAKRGEKQSSGMAAATAKKKRISKAMNLGFLFCLIYPPVYGLLYSTHWFESMLGKQVQGDWAVLSQQVDIAMFVVNILCPIIGTLIYRLTRDVLED